MLEIETPAEIVAYVGQELGTSPWLTVDQAMIDKFAEVTGDDQWIHVDVERAKREMPDGRTIAHGYLTISLIPKLLRHIWQVKRRSRSINYGSNKIRFLTPVQSARRTRKGSRGRSATFFTNRSSLPSPGRISRVAPPASRSSASDGLGSPVTL